MAKPDGQTGGDAAYVSDWIEVPQDLIDQFADLTEDWNAIHVDEAAARAAGLPGTIAHGFLVLSLLAPLASDSGLPVADGNLNYGFDSVRFISPVPAGSRIRATFRPVGEEVTASGTRRTFDVLVECEGAARPAIAARWILFHPG
ncbi:MaoC/PaaZ C-terminal domain-containing protein [Croceicoccus bisphenolivorans]|uniref:MaoC/PaaZ C-terminal domain-containing protein n=1 Tax=Croceicoccus bisphenolivorans TaxID=1783232 RepID=UPI000833AFD0|nr:MaoC/PaaZ C-terminal domain-containing protein [Croceicoccus bisphenolivorans]